MNYFFKQKNEESIKVNLAENEQKQNENLQQHRPPVRKIIVKKKNKKSLQDISDHIVQTQSQHYVDVGAENNKNSEEPNIERENKKKLKPFISFMASQNGSSDQLQTPYLHAQSPSLNFDSVKMNVQPVPIEEVQDVEERMIARTKSKPIEQILLQSPLNKNIRQLMRRNSFKSEIPTLQKRQFLNAAQVSSQKDDYSSMYERSKQGSRPKLTLKQNKEEKISVLQDEFSQNTDIVSLKQPKSTQSTQFLLRQDQYGTENEQISYVNNGGRMGRKSLNPGINPMQSKLSSAIQSSQSESQSVQPQQLTSRIQIPADTYITSKPSGYTSYIELQSRQLEQQQRRMNFYADETNKLLCNVDNDSGRREESVLDKHYHPLKYMIEELVELFCMSEVIKYQLKYRSYEIINKIYAQASVYYQEKILIQDPIKAYTFSLALKAILPKYQKSQLDIVISKIFQSQHLLPFQKFSEKLQPILHSKIVSLLQPQSMKKELDKTLQKAKRLFVIWIEIEYFTKKIREVLRNTKVIYDSIILECTSIQEPTRLDMELLQKYFLQGQKKNSLKKLKLDVFFRNTIGNDLLKNNWSDWIYKQEVRLYNRYEGKAVYERLHFENRPDRKQNYVKSSVNRKKIDVEQTSIMNTSRKVLPSQRNF